jgi:hypothetical protein
MSGIGPPLAIADVLGLLQGITMLYSSCRSDATPSRPEVKWDGA